jgi:hypothetical protein
MNFRFVVVAIYGLATLSCAKGCAKHEAAAPRQVLTAIRTAAAPKIDGEAEDEVWLRAKPTQAFSYTDGGPGRPYAEVRASWDDLALYLLFYNGDEDLEPDDTVSAELTGGNKKTTRLVVSVDGRLQGPQEIQSAIDRDGSVSDAGDDDEEWLVELRIPWDTLGKTDSIGAVFGRHDKPKDAPPRDLVWTGEIHLAR